MKRVLAIILVAVMCLALMPAVLVSAEGTNTSATVTNLFELKGYGEPNATDPTGDLKSTNAHFIAGKAIAVSEGDVIMIAPSFRHNPIRCLLIKTAPEQKYPLQQRALSLFFSATARKAPL